MSNMQAYDRLTALVQQVGQYKQARRHREIDEQATGMLQQGAPPEEVERFLITSMAPEQRGGLGGIADNLVGGATPPTLSPMQEHVSANRTQRAFPTIGQEAQTAQAGRAAEMHEPQMRQIEANIKRLELAGNPHSRALRDVGSALNALSQQNFGQYDEQIKGLSASLEQLVSRVVAGQDEPATGSADPTGATGVQAGWLGGPINPNLNRTSPGKAPTTSPQSTQARPSGSQRAWDMMDQFGTPGTPDTPQAKATAQQPNQANAPVRFSTDTPPSLQERIKRLVDAGVSMDQIMAAEEVKPYLIRE